MNELNIFSVKFDSTMFRISELGIDLTKKKKNPRRTLRSRNSSSLVRRYRYAVKIIAFYK